MFAYTPGVGRVSVGGERETGDSDTASLPPKLLKSDRPKDSVLDSFFVGSNANFLRSTMFPFRFDNNRSGERKRGGGGGK